jgi:hypothetical protein
MAGDQGVSEARLEKPTRRRLSASLKSVRSLIYAVPVIGAAP